MLAEVELFFPQSQVFHDLYSRIKYLWRTLQEGDDENLSSDIYSPDTVVWWKGPLPTSLWSLALNGAKGLSKSAEFLDFSKGCEH